jgi:hypothetical protein
MKSSLQAGRPKTSGYPSASIRNRPVDWGKRMISTMFDLNRLRTSGVAIPQSRHGIVDIRQQKPPYLTMHMESLRPEETHVSDGDEVVLLMFGTEAPSTVTAGWRVTAQGINDIFEGTMMCLTQSSRTEESVSMSRREECRRATTKSMI